MPELPEVETIRNDLLFLEGERIKSVQIFLPRIARRHDDPSVINDRIAGLRIEKIKRRAKSLLLVLEKGQILVFHLGMTGQILISTPERIIERDRYTHALVTFTQGKELLFKDIRQFGEVYVTDEKTFEETVKLGPEPLDLSLERLKQILARPTKIKPLLMDQSKIAGIGNIYSDEILFEAGIYPARPANTLSGEDQKKLFQAIKKILKEGIKYRGSSIENFLDAQGEPGSYDKRHRVYARTGKECVRCGDKIQRIKLGGRSAHFSPGCQK